MFKRLQYCSSRATLIPILLLTFSLNRSFTVKIYDPIYTNLVPEIFELNTTIDQAGRITTYLNVKRDLTNAFVHLFSVFDGEGIGQQNVVYVNQTINICSFLRNQNESMWLRFLLNIARKYGVLPKRCPLKKKLFYVINMKILPDNYLPFVPIGNGTMTFTAMLKLPGDKELTVATRISVGYKFEKEFKRIQKGQ